MMCGSTWRSYSAMLLFAGSNGILPSADTTGDTRRSREIQYTLYAEALAPTRGSLSFHTFRSKRMFSECVENLTPPPM